MKRDIWTDRELREAAKKVREAMLDSVPPPSQCPHEFSLPYQAKMAELSKKAEKKATIKTWKTRVAAVFLIIALSLSICFFANPEAVAAVRNWAVEQYENSIIYRFFTGDYTKDCPKTNVGWLPPGYDIALGSEYCDVEAKFYENTNGDRIYFLWFSASDGAFTKIENSDKGPIYIHGGTGIYIENSSGKNELTWIDAQGQFAYSITGAISQEDMVKMAQSIF